MLARMMVRIAAGYVMGQRSKAGDVCCRMRERPPRVNVCLLARMLYEKKKIREGSEIPGSRCHNPLSTKYSTSRSGFLETVQDEA